MPLSPDLFDSMTLPSVWVTLAALDHPEADSRLLTIRIQEVGKRSISVCTDVSRYSPEPSLFLAISKMIERIQSAQVPLTRTLLLDALQAALTEWVEPF